LSTPLRYQIAGLSPILTISASSSETVFQAKVVLPFAFIRIFITNPEDGCVWGAWLVKYDSFDYVCAQYMIEGITLYKYDGPVEADAQGNRPWKWKMTGDFENVKLERNKYKYTWKVPLGLGTFDPNNFIIEADGYSPEAAVVHPCPKYVPDLSSGKSCEGPQVIKAPAPISQDPIPYDCGGKKPLCGSTNVKYCDKAINNIIPKHENTIYHTDRDISASGTCWGNFVGVGCKVTIENTVKGTGKQCEITGRGLYDAYQDIRKVGSCKVCGFKNLANGCRVRIDAHDGCGNTTPGQFHRYMNLTELGSEDLS
jgi:hypothetical protein